MPENIGPYRVERLLGEGGMGQVYAARDPHLDRPVAIKVMREMNAEIRHRFLREARLAAAISHPNICQIHALGEEDGRPYIVMELLEGESLATRLERGRLPHTEAVDITLGMLAALDALHQRELVHRDLKPSNVFLTPHGPKLLDFGLARPVAGAVAPDAATTADLTQPGIILGTPRYMSPEQLLGQSIGTASDIFSAGAILYEMLSGRKAFPADTVMAILHAVLYEPRPPLGEAPALEAVIHRALARATSDRYGQAQEMADALRQAREPSGAARAPRRQTRLIVIPLRMLRPDPEIDFLAFSLPDAISASLAALDSVVVRSSLAAARLAGPAPDPAEIARAAEVDLALTGSILRAGDQIRVSAQLVETPAGTVIWTHTTQVTLRDIFQLQDELVGRIVDSLAAPLTVSEQSHLKHDVPANSAAYELYLRANRLSLDYGQIQTARDLYLRCLKLDPQYAPAWARVGRCHWLHAKWVSSAEEDMRQAQEAFQRAFELNPDLPIAHTLHARLECDLGRPQAAMVHLLERARVAHNDPELFSSLVQSCRFCGLLEASVAAHRRCRELDPQVPTGVNYTYLMMGDYERVLEMQGWGFQHSTGLALGVVGRRAEGIAILREGEAVPGGSEALRDFMSSARAALEGQREECLAISQRLLALKYLDLEGRYLLCRQFAQIGELDRALQLFAEAVAHGYCCTPAMVRDPWLEPLRAMPEFVRGLERAERGHQAALQAFRQAGGETILG
jgi:non-specific serine/threonine protein kinase